MPMRIARWVDGRNVKSMVRMFGVMVLVSTAISAVTLVRQSNEAALREADHRASNAAQVTLCYQQVKNAPAVIRILGLLDVLATNSIKGSQQALKVAKPGDPLIPVREATLRRLLPARADLRNFIQTTKDQTPRIIACHKLALTLHVEDVKLKPKGT